MTYRDDADALFERSAALQREVDEMREQLADRDRRLAEMGTGVPFNGSAPPRIPPQPVEYPDAAAMIDRLLENTERMDAMPSEPFPAQAVATVELTPDPLPPGIDRAALVAQIRTLAKSLADDHLVMIGSIIEALASPRIDADFIYKLRTLAQRAAWSR